MKSLIILPFLFAFGCEGKSIYASDCKEMCEATGVASYSRQNCVCKEGATHIPDHIHFKHPTRPDVPVETPSE